MATRVKPIPEGFRTVTPYLTLSGAADAIAFYQKAFGAVVKYLIKSPDGKVAHAEIQIGDSIIMLGDEFPMGNCKSPKTLGATTAGLNLSVEDVDAMFNRAVSAGAKVAMPVQNMFWGDRYGKLSDPFRP